MRYLKLTFGVLLAVAGVVATVGAAFGLTVYVRECVGTQYALGHVSGVCRGTAFAMQLSIWALAAGLLDVAAILTIRHRADPQGNRSGTAEGMPSGIPL